MHFCIRIAMRFFKIAINAILISLIMINVLKFKIQIKSGLWYILAIMG